jgi:hypothetical protein
LPKAKHIIEAPWIQMLQNGNIFLVTLGSVTTRFIHVMKSDGRAKNYNSNLTGSFTSSKNQSPRTASPVS